MSQPVPGTNPNIFANNPLDRASLLREDAAWLAARLADPGTLLIPLWRLKPFLLGDQEHDPAVEAGWLRPGLLDSFLGPDPMTVFLGLENGKARFAVEIPPEFDPETEGPLAGLGRFRELREIAARIAGGDAAILAQAKSMIDWHRRHRFCANCGATTERTAGGYRRDCRACNAQHFPRTDPVVIMLPLHGDRCLMGRGPNWPEPHFSALAGFLEPGETIEDAVTREVHEETAVHVTNVRYRFCQPWPYPSSLMIGCFCDARTTEITLDPAELADARWFTRADAEAALAGAPGAPFRAPPPFAIARHLLQLWLKE